MNVNELPNEILCIIFSMVDFNILDVSRVCRRWKSDNSRISFQISERNGINGFGMFIRGETFDCPMKVSEPNLPLVIENEFTNLEILDAKTRCDYSEANVKRLGIRFVDDCRISAPIRLPTTCCEFEIFNANDHAVIHCPPDLRLVRINVSPKTRTGVWKEGITKPIQMKIETDASSVSFESIYAPHATLIMSVHTLANCRFLPSITCGHLVITDEGLRGDRIELGRVHAIILPEVSRNITLTSTHKLSFDRTPSFTVTNSYEVVVNL